MVVVTTLTELAAELGIDPEEVPRRECEDCGQVFGGETEREAINSKAAHVRWECDGVDRRELEQQRREVLDELAEQVGTVDER